MARMPPAGPGLLHTGRRMQHNKAQAQAQSKHGIIPSTVDTLSTAAQWTHSAQQHLGHAQHSSAVRSGHVQHSSASTLCMQAGAQRLILSVQESEVGFGLGWVLQGRPGAALRAAAHQGTTRAPAGHHQGITRASPGHHQGPP